MRASYRRAVSWIAANLEECSDLEEMAGWTVVLLVSDIFGKEPIDVAEAVLRQRRATHE